MNEEKLTAAELVILSGLYQQATSRKIAISIIVMLISVTVSLATIDLSDSLTTWSIAFILMAAAIAPCVVIVFALINDSYYDIATSINPNLYPDDKD